MRGPISVTFACLVGIVITQLCGYHGIPENLPLDSAAVVSTTLIIMEMGTSEKFYMKTTYRVIGVGAGICIGIVYAILEQKAKDSWGMDEKWMKILFRVALLAPTIFAATVSMKKFPTYAPGLSVMAIHIPIAMLAKTMHKAIGIAMALMMAVIIAIITLIIFERLTSESMLLDTNRNCIHGVLSVVQLGITSDPMNSEKFTKHTNEVHKTVSSAESAMETYMKWRSMTCREPRHDFKALLKPIRALFYQGYALYWTNVSSFHADQYKANILFCDSEQLYDKHFRNQVEELVHIFEGIKDTLGNIFSHSGNSKGVPITELVDHVIINGLWNGICRLQESLKRTYFQHRKDCFSTVRQRWNVLDYLRQLAMITLAFVEFSKTLVNVFETPKRRPRLLNLLDEISEGLDRLRKEEEKKSVHSTLFGSLSTIKPTYSGLSLVSLGLYNSKPTSPTSLATEDTVPPIPENQQPDDEQVGERINFISRDHSMGGI
jgi:hypothetical protein